MEANELRKADAMERRDRGIRFEWTIGESNGKRRVAVLSIGHRKAGVNYLSGTQHPSEFYALLRNENVESRDGMTARSFGLFEAVSIDREQVARYSAKGLDRFAGQALARLGELYATDERVRNYFDATPSTDDEE